MVWQLKNVQKSQYFYKLLPSHFFPKDFDRLVKLGVRLVLEVSVRVQVDLDVGLDALEVDVIAAPGVIIGDRDLDR